MTNQDTEISFSFPSFTFSSFKFLGSLSMHVNTDHENTGPSRIRFSSLHLQHIDAEICEIQPKNLLSQYVVFKDILRLKIFCPLYSLQEHEKSRLQNVQLTRVENYMVESGDFDHKVIEFINLLSSQKNIEVLKFEICSLGSLEHLWLPLSKISAFEVDIKLEQVQNLHLDQDSLLTQFNNFYQQYNPKIQVITLRHLAEVVSLRKHLFSTKIVHRE